MGQRVQFINQTVQKLTDAFKRQPGIFLTEEDMRCHLFALLLQRPEFARLSKTKDGQFSIPLHAQVRWYGKSKDLRLLSDLVLIDVKDLRVDKYGRLSLPSKGYGFNNFYAIFELKLRRPKGQSNNRWIDDIKKDLDKLKKIKKSVINKYSALLLLIAFDKKQDVSLKVENLSKKANYDSIKTVYQFV